MAHLWDRGVLNASSWHGLEEIGKFATAGDAIAHGEKSGAWPVKLESGIQLATPGGLIAPLTAIVGHYAAHPVRVLGAVGKKYRPTTPEEWRELVSCAAAAGAEPTGAFSLAGGARVLATFNVGKANGLRTQFCIVDSFDGSLQLKAFDTTIRVVCANTLARAWDADGVRANQTIRHTASAAEKIKALGAAIGQAIKHGETVREAYDRARNFKLSGVDAEALIKRLFPDAPEGAAAATRTRVEEKRKEVLAAASMPINNEGATLATLWNAATYVVDRQVVTADGSTLGVKRPCRNGADMLNSMLFGERGKQVDRVQYLVNVVMRDGTTQAMSLSDAHGSGAMSGADILASILED